MLGHVFKDGLCIYCDKRKALNDTSRELLAAEMAKTVTISRERYITYEECRAFVESYACHDDGRLTPNEVRANEILAKLEALDG